MAVATGEGALAGIRVLDLGIIVQGPQAAQLLRDLGADVIKIELPGIGDQARWIPLSLEDRRSAYFVGCNRGKRGMTLDLRTQAGRDVMLHLVEEADVVVSNFVPGTLEAWGLGYEVLAARNPRLVLGCGSTFGPAGPDASRKGADLAGQAAGGLIRSMGSASDQPTPVGVTIADHIGSQNLANGVLAALVARQRTGRGQKVEVSLLGGQIYAQASEITAVALTGRPNSPEPGGHPLISMFYGVVPTSDGQIALVGILPDERPAFFAAIGRPELAEDPRFAEGWFPPGVRGELFEALAEAFRKRSTAEWVGVLAAGNYRYAVVHDQQQVLEDEGALANGYLQRVDHPEWGELTMVGSPIRMSDTPARPGRFAPELGQHTEEILLEHGYDWEAIAHLREQGAI
ncbi:MAG: CoA transferase [Myxococcales bacterium]|nr:CoA transferase [Myxococcales bacterium]